MLSKPAVIKKQEEKQVTPALLSPEKRRLLAQLAKKCRYVVVELNEVKAHVETMKNQTDLTQEPQETTETCDSLQKVEESKEAEMGEAGVKEYPTSHNFAPYDQTPQLSPSTDQTPRLPPPTPPHCTYSSDEMTAALWSWRSRRMRIAILCLLALTIEGLMRSNINMAMVCMLKETAMSPSGHSPNTSTPSPEDCPMLDIKFGSVQKPPSGTLDWNAQQRGLIFTSFYFGGLLSCFFIEVLNRRLGPKRVVLYGAVANVVGTFATPPVAANFPVAVLIAVRFIMGFGQGLLWPCMNVLVTHWFPVTEKSTALAITTTGNQLSVIIAMFATAELCQLPFGGGWPMAFHVYGIVGVILCITWHLYVCDSPSNAKDITEEELQVIHGGSGGRVKPKKADWKLLLRSPLIWAIAASSFAHNYITVGTVTYLPLYYKTVLRMSLTSNGLLSAVPFVFQLISKFIYAGIADGFKKKDYLSFTTITKICNTSASFGLAFCFFFLCFCDCIHRIWAVTLVCIAMAFVSGYVPGYNTSIVVVAPAQTAAVAAFSRIWGQVAATLAPYQIGSLTRKGVLEEWRIIFATIVVICIASGILFQIYGSADEQNWAKEAQLMPSEEDKRPDEADEVERQ